MSYGKPRLRQARYMLLNEENVEDLGFERFEDALRFGEGLFSYWRDFSEFILLKKEFLGREEKPTKFFAVKCSKRGNDVYERRVKARLGWLDREIEDKKFFEIRDFQVDKVVHTSLLWVTLTWDSKHEKLINAWESVGKEYNRFISALRRKYGKISVLRVWEAYESGYPHIHAVMLFHDAKFKVFPHYSQNERKLTFRIDEKDAIADFWHSHVDIQAISSLRNVFTYLKKHQEKIILGLSGAIQEGEGELTSGFDLENIKGLRTLFLCWIFRKRSFSVSGDFREVLSDLISHLHNSNMDMQVDLEGSMVKEWEYVFLGVFTGEELGIPPFIWVKELDKGLVTELLENRNRHAKT